MTDLIEGTLEKARAAIATHDLVAPDAAVLLMVSGGSDSTALAYLGAALREAGDVGPVAMLHVNHRLRGEAADADARFVAQLAKVLEGLAERERKVISLRFGLEDGHPRTLEEVGREFGVTRERIRQIESKTLTKLRHPSRSSKLKDYLED